MISQISLLIFLLMMSALFSSTETAFTSLSLFQIHEIEKTKGKRGRRVTKLTKKPNVLLTTLLIGNNLANIGATALATSLTISIFGSQFIGFMTGILTLFVLIFGEVTPKQIALAKNESICLRMARPVHILSFIFRPVIWAISGISSLITRLFAGQVKKSFTLDNLLQMVSLGENMGIVESYEKQMVKNVFRINDTPVKGITTYRTEVFCLDKESAIEDILDELLEKDFSRVPVYNDNPEHIVGIVWIKDILKALAAGEKGLRLKDNMHEPFYIPETKMVHDLFHQFKEEKINLAVVLDEYGGLTGIVTMEDVIEEIFGELYDENEETETDKILTGDNNEWIIQGDTSFYDLYDHLGLDLEHDIKTLTISGYLTEKLGVIPIEGTEAVLPEGRYTVSKVTNNKIEEIRFKKSGKS
ncbi:MULTISPECIES: hemolysin family protein [unclassified Oceanispirochaeta]|uniref:hemolysin family protein n=1 Tax=unclassified Oceanispirochaeta TaxID=2635722 RepID=UPI000E095215|nr:MULTISPECIES: hemolysin family protein [unclassified Oceanispirochaeta]MBF9015370.1 HlyC/CorC family transporter [Oceanispirochaeta sp. M2]NPD71829.1 HlyC/CorC family transporter [Oceanispirochaeta sp. M1]RDG32640.1 HlyC/CorC family transporter [Oceanispirochaeta sp. M1]